MSSFDTEMRARHAKKESGSADVFADAFNYQLPEMARSVGLYPYYWAIERNEGCTAVFQGVEVIMMGSNNYLGLTADEQVRKKSAEAVLEYGTSSTGSRILNGTTRLHEELERRLAEFVGKPAALVFAAGYMANLGTLSGLIGKNGYGIIDRYAHTSIHDGIRLSKGELVKFEHNNMDDLRNKLGEVPGDAPKLVIVDAVYSMEGDKAPLADIVEICGEYGARLMVDEAHSIGVYGKTGEGLVSELGLTDKVDIIMGTFSKSLASQGGFVATHPRVIDYIKHVSHGILFSAALAPAAVAAAAESLSMIQTSPKLKEKVRDNARYWREGLKSRGYSFPQSDSPIVPIFVGDEFNTLTLWSKLIKNGLYTNAVLYPAVPKNHGVLRTSTIASHTKEHLDKALEILYSTMKEMKLVS
ncbi:MAG: pyridoxal phosphate-dependent aminotransferase family protein [Myxococcota bacterium]